MTTNHDPTPVVLTLGARDDDELRLSLRALSWRLGDIVGNGEQELPWLNVHAAAMQLIDALLIPGRSLTRTRASVLLCDEDEAIRAAAWQLVADLVANLRLPTTGRTINLSDINPEALGRCIRGLLASSNAIKQILGLVIRAQLEGELSEAACLNRLSLLLGLGIPLPHDHQHRDAGLQLAVAVSAVFRQLELLPLTAASR